MKPESIAGRWDYSSVTEPFHYGKPPTYQLAANWLNVCKEVEDRGCGLCYAKRYFTVPYRGVDGSHNPWLSEVVDLVTYRRKVSGILMRHVLEHNPEWRVILKNALEDFADRMALLLHTRMAQKDELLGQTTFASGIQVPSYSLCEGDLAQAVAPYLNHQESFENETLFYLEKA